MPASLSGNVITLSGAWNLNELTGIAGVTTQAITALRYPLTIYTLSGVKLKFTGTGTISRSEKLILTGQGASDGIFDVDGGTVTIDNPYTRNGFTYSLPQEAIVFALSSDGTWSTRVLRVINAGKFICRNALIRIPHSIWFEQNTDGQVLIENSVIDKTGSTGDIQTNHAGSGDNNTVIRNSVILCDGQSGLTFRNSFPPTIENVAIYQARDAWNNESGTYKVVRGLVPDVGNTVDISQWVGNTVVVVNPRKGVQFLWGGHLDGYYAENYGVVVVYQEVKGSIKTTSGAGIAGAVRYITDNPVAADPAQTSVFTQTGATINPSVRRVYIQTSDGSGAFAQQDILIGTGLRTVGGLQIVGGNANRIRPRGKNTTSSVDATDDVYEYTDLAYDYLPSTNPVTLKGGTAGVLDFGNTALVDSNVTLSEAAAGALTSIDNLDQLHDAAKHWKTRPVQAQLEYPTIGTQPITPSGTVLNLGNRNLVVDGAAADGFAINTGTDTNTIKSLNLAAGVKFKSLTTTGTVTFVNGATSSGIAIEDANGVRVTIRKSGGGNFNIAARYGSGSTYTGLGYQADVSTITYTVPKGQPVEVVMWALGYVTYSRLISTVNGGVVFDAEMTLNESINTSLDVSPYLPNIALSLDTSGASPVFVITFNAAMTIAGIELGKAVIHRLVGQEIALKAGFPPGSTATIVINSDEITNQLPAARLALGAGLSVTDRVYLDFFINTAPALALNPAYVINPPRADGNQVVVLRAKPALDASVMALAVRQEIERTGGMLASKATSEQLGVVNGNLRPTSLGIPHDNDLEVAS